MGLRAEWFEKLICQEDGVAVPQAGKCKAVDLKSSFTRLGWSKLAELAAKFPRDMLPPLSAGAFEDQNRNP